MEFEEKPEKIKRDRTGLSRGSVTNDVSRGKITIVPRNTVLIQKLTILVKGMADSQKHEKIPQLERLELGREKGNCGRVFQFIFQLDKRLEAYGKDEEKKKWYFFENVGVAWVRKLKERGGSYNLPSSSKKEIEWNRQSR
jgi:hypothetical protein